MVRQLWRKLSVDSYEVTIDKRGVVCLKLAGKMRDARSATTRKAQEKAGWDGFYLGFLGPHECGQQRTGFSFNRYKSCALENLFVPLDSVNPTLAETDGPLADAAEKRPELQSHEPACGSLMPPFHGRTACHNDMIVDIMTE